MRGSRAEALFLAAVLTAFTLMLISRHGRWAGGGILELTPTHGVNGGDVLAFGLWAASMAVLCRLGVTEKEQARLVAFVTRAGAPYVSRMQRRSSRALWRAGGFVRNLPDRIRGGSPAMVSFPPSPEPSRVATRHYDDEAGSSGSGQSA